MDFTWLTDRVRAALEVQPPVAPAHGRQPTSILSKALTSCHFCNKTKGPGVILRKCQGCEGELYCGKECQRAAWNNHKRKCAVNRRLLSMEDHRLASLKALRAFTNKHRASIIKASIEALNLAVDMSGGQRDVVIILLRPRPDSNRAETFFFAADIFVAAIDSYPESEELHAQLALVLANIRQKTDDPTGALLAVLMDTESLISDVLPVAFSTPPEGLPAPGVGWPWKTWLMSMLNEGIML